MVSAVLAVLAACAPVRRSPTARPAADLPPPSRTVDGTAVAVVDDGRTAVEAMIDALRGAFDGRDTPRLRGLFSPVLRGVQRPGPGMSRETWLTHADALFLAAARARAGLQARPRIEAYAECAPRCSSALLAPGEWLVHWPGVAVERTRPGMPSNRVLPTTLRVEVNDGVAQVVGVDDEVAGPWGPVTMRASGSPRP